MKRLSIDVFNSNCKIFYSKLLFKFVSVKVQVEFFVQITFQILY